MGRKSRAKHSGKPPAVGAYTNKKEVDRLVQKLINACVKPTTKKNEWDHFLEIQFLVERLRQYQSGLKLSAKDRMGKLATFETWLKENGSTMNNVVMENYGGEMGIGLKATTDLKKSDKLIEVPYEIMLSYEKAKESYLGDFIASQRLLTEMPNLSLCLYLHCERCNPDSFYKPYIDVLPTEYNTTLYFSVKEMEYLKGSAVLSAAISQYKSIARQYGAFYNMMHGDKITPESQKIPLAARNEFTYDAYRWAVSTVSTRVNKVPIIPKEENHDTCGHDGPCHGHSDTGMTLGLIPLWDMMNHCQGEMSTDCDPEKKFCFSFAMKDFKADEQVTIFYGPRSNLHHLIHNGFIMPNNPMDRVEILLGVSTNDKLYQKRVWLLEKHRIPPSGFFHILDPNENIPASPDLLAFLRVFHMTEEELDSWYAKEHFGSDGLRDIYMPGPKSREMDLKIWKFLENRIDLLLKGYKRLDEEEDTILADPVVSERIKLAIKFHKERKRILAECREFCREFPLDPKKYIAPLSHSMMARLKREGILTSGHLPGMKHKFEGGGEKDSKVDVQALRSAMEEIAIDTNAINGSGNVEPEQGDKIEKNEPHQDDDILKSIVEETAFDEDAINGSGNVEPEQTDKIEKNELHHVVEAVKSNVEEIAVNGDGTNGSGSVEPEQTNIMTENGLHSVVEVLKPTMEEIAIDADKINGNGDVEPEHNDKIKVNELHRDQKVEDENANAGVG